MWKKEIEKRQTGVHRVSAYRRKRKSRRYVGRKMFAHLANEVFPTRKIGLLHGKMKADEKDKVMQSFKNGELDILVSTTVIEVGVDVPNATIMLIENAVSFAFSHLLYPRSRVGRGEHKSYCILFCNALDNEKNRRANRKLWLNRPTDLKLRKRP
ncbi:MAG: hypothetical protein L6V93_15740 [Clostridiales bacterium]|nr:MAG: hypothetical protein L6V93_15740 [Clostridiales bacterium]